MALEQNTADKLSNSAFALSNSLQAVIDAVDALDPATEDVDLLAAKLVVNAQVVPDPYA